MKEQQCNGWTRVSSKVDKSSNRIFASIFLSDTKQCGGGSSFTHVFMSLSWLGTRPNVGGDLSCDGWVIHAPLSPFIFGLARGSDGNG